MQHFMLKLDRVLVRRRWLVLGAWVAALLVALPFAAKQGEHLTGGGFGVPGSQSKAVAEATDDDFGGAGHAQLGAVLVSERGASKADARRALLRVKAAADAAPDVALDPKAFAAAQRGLGAPTLIVPLTTTVDDVKSTDLAKDLRERLDIRQDQSGPVVVH